MRCGCRAQPIRGALSYLAERGLVEHRPNRGYFLKVNSDEMVFDALEIPETGAGQISRSVRQRMVRHTRDPNRSPSGSSAYATALADWPPPGSCRSFPTRESSVETQGHGWHFEPSLNHKGTREESYAFRMALEPGAIRSRAFKLDHGLADLSRRDHEAALHSPVERTALATLTTIDAAFHRLIGVSSRNRHVLAAIERQNASCAES